MVAVITRISSYEVSNQHLFRGMEISPSVTVSCTSLSETILLKARELAKNLGLPFGPPGSSPARYILTLTDTRLELGPNTDHLGGQPIFSPIAVDFLGGSTAYRHARNCTIKQPLARAVGIRSGFRPVILDATAGLGGDSFVLACLGCRVFMHERSRIIAALLADGMARAMDDPATAEIVSGRMVLIPGDSRMVLQSVVPPPYTIYLDPMYPHAAKSALNKKEMRMIRDIVGDDLDGAELLQSALTHASNRVVVKRPKGAEYLGGRKPSHEIVMKNSRFDVYLTLHL
jgi:16S rRNA (guanine1516-N2)-methyltransferase